MMLRRSLLIAGIGLLPVFGKSQKSRASEAHAAVSNPSVFDLNGSVKARIETVLAKDGYRLTGEMRRKGQLISTIAERDGVSWKLVLDGNSGEVVGRRLMTISISTND